jgi:hypothetical protein
MKINGFCKTMDAAKKLYTEFCDFDYIDYSETYNSDLLFIQELIKDYGLTDARKILKSYFE